MSLYEIPVTTIDGKDTTLADHAGEVMLVVNVAAASFFTFRRAVRRSRSRSSAA